MPTTPTAHFWHDPAWPAVVELRRPGSRASLSTAQATPPCPSGRGPGRSQFTGHRQAPQDLGPGAVVVVPAQVVHACNPAPDQAWSYQMLHLEAGWWATLWAECGLPPGTRPAWAAPGAVPRLLPAERPAGGPGHAGGRQRSEFGRLLATRLWRLPELAAWPAPAAAPGLTALLQALAEGEGPCPACPSWRPAWGEPLPAGALPAAHRPDPARLAAQPAGLRAGPPCAGHRWPSWRTSRGLPTRATFSASSRPMGVTPHGYRQRKA
jgi:hypothetical protein